MSRTSVRLVADSAELAVVMRIRHEVFVKEQAVPVELERDQWDEGAEHFLALLDGRPAGTVRLVDEHPGEAHLGRLAVLPPARGTGLGVALVRAVEERARERSLVSVVLGAQTQALTFYARLGYTAEGEIFDDAGIPHRWMRKRLVS